MRLLAKEVASEKGHDCASPAAKMRERGLLKDYAGTHDPIVAEAQCAASA